MSPPDAVAEDTYEPTWNVMMPHYFRYDMANKDEFTIVVLDRDTDVLQEATQVFSHSRIEVGAGAVFIGIEHITEASFNGDDLEGRWSGKIPKELLLSDEDTPWEIQEFTRSVSSMKLLIEKRSSPQ